MPDLDNVLDPRPHDEYNKERSDKELIEIYVRRTKMSKPTWQVEREMERRPGLMERARKALRDA